MLKTHTQHLLFSLSLSIFCLNLFAQNEISSPYSNYGVGLYSNVTSGMYDAMGKVGYALQDPYQINFKNPASYVAFDSLSFIADASFSIYSNSLANAEIKQKATLAHPNYLTLGLPVTRHWRMSAGILPFSNLGYNIVQSINQDNIGVVNYNYQGDGGLLQLYWGNGFKLYDGLSLGFNISYLFGRLTYMQTAEFEGNNFYHSMVNNTTLIDGIYLSAGLQYFATIKNNHKLGIGLVYENSAYIWTKEEQFLYNYSTIGGSDNVNDTSYYYEYKGNMQLPQSVGAGLSYQYKNKLWVSADFKWHNWAQYYHNKESDERLQNTYITSLGVQFIPNATSTNYFKKIRIRAGVQYSTGHILLNNHTISDYSISIGLGFPLKLYNNNSSLGVLFEYGQMGTIRNDLIRENHFRISFHFTLQEKWYQRVKLD